MILGSDCYGKNNNRSSIKMIKILFVCHGNSCRSPMAEFILKKLVDDKKLNNNFLIE